MGGEHKIIMTNRELAYTYMVLYLAEKYTKHGYLKSNQIEPAFTHIKLIKFNIQNDYSQRKCDLFHSRWFYITRFKK